MSGAAEADGARRRASGWARLVVYDCCAAPTVLAVRLQAVTPVCSVQWNAIWGEWRPLSQE